MSRLCSFAMALNYLILNYLRLNYVPKTCLPRTYIRPVLMPLFNRNFIILSTWLYNYKPVDY